MIDVQRGGPSTGLPTKTEQADLLQAMFGRNGEAPVPILAPRSPGDCFDAALEAARIAVTYRTPVLAALRRLVANGSEPWRMPDVDDAADIDPAFATAPELRRTAAEFWPYLRDDDTLARPWAIPGTPGLEHRIGGLEKADGRGSISYDPANHDRMARLRAGEDRRHRRARTSRSTTRPATPSCWCSAGARPTGRSAPAPAGCASSATRVAQAHLRHLNPLPANLGEVLRRYRRVLVPEMNLGQLALLLRARVPRRRAELHEGRRPAVPRGGAAERLPGPPRPEQRPPE